MTPPALRILGIDPGSNVTGYGIVEWHGGRATHIASGCLRVSGDELAARLGMIFDGLSRVLDTYQPHEAAVEQVFMARNPDSALKLGQARGAAISAVVTRAVPVAEYSARQIKLAVVGRGNAAKQQVQHMVTALLKLQATPPADAADALATALCHAYHHTSPAVLASSSRRRGRWRL
ncbi:MAG: crossover junction endodeoxyribonuclease RuvC [Gammaproteobacteria bacterium SG8_47]|nr:MAG: crossover junction endodeoxyribonuclease RuvC [Gammaproteobacteria bacterium SG8_47]